MRKSSIPSDFVNLSRPRITGKRETLGGAPSTYAYTCDAMSRLDTVTRNGGLVEDYDYDAQGRRTSEFNALRGISSRTATYDDDDRLLTSSDYAYGFDADGFLNVRTNMTTQETTTYAYARTGQLDSVELPDGTLIEYLHNAAGQRVAKKVNGVITEKYLWAGITGLLAVYDGSNNLVMRFEGAKMVKNGQTYYLITDQVGSIRAVVDASGNIVKEITYDSFGNILDDTASAFAIPLGFAGGLHDRDTGLVRFGFRDYDPDSGTWTAKEPMGLPRSSPYLYSYCSQDPVSASDQTGLYGWYPGLVTDTSAGISLLQQSAELAEQATCVLIVAYVNDAIPHAAASLNLTANAGYSVWPNRPGIGGTASVGVYADTRTNVGVGVYYGVGPTLSYKGYKSVGIEASAYKTNLCGIRGPGYQLGAQGLNYGGELLLNNQGQPIGATGVKNLWGTPIPTGYLYVTNTHIVHINLIEGIIDSVIGTAGPYLTTMYP